MRLKNTVLLRLLVFVLAAMLLPVFGVFAEETEEQTAIVKEKGLPGVNPATLFSWYYATADLPSGSTLADNSLRFDKLYPAQITGDAETPEGEKVTGATVTWKDGGYYLIKAIQVTVDDEGAEIRLNPDKMKWTGNTVVILTLESEHYRYETQQALLVLDPTKTPAFTQKVFNPVFNVALGSTFTAQDLLGGIATVDYPAFCQANRLPYPDAEVKVEETEIPGITLDENTGVFTLEDYGVYDLNLKLRIANLVWKLPFRIEAEPYSITGPGFVMPGTNARYRVTDQDAAAGRLYTWSVEGDGVTIDPKDGTLSVSEDAKTNTYIKVLLTPDKDPAINTSVLVPEGVLPQQLYVMHETETEGESEKPAEPAPLTDKEAGFSVAVPEGDNWRTGVSANRQDGWMFRCVTSGTGGATVAVDARTDRITTGFREDDLAAMSYYNENTFPDSVKNQQSRDIRIDGHLAREYLFTITDQNGQATHYGQICYCRNNQALTVRVFTTKQGTGADNLIPVTMKDLDRIAEGIRYEPDENTITREDARLTLTIPQEEDLLVVGKSLPLTVDFANPDKINDKAKNNGITWVIKDAETGEVTDAASVSAYNVLSVKRELDKVMKLEVTAVSEAFGTKASGTITVCPLTQEISVEPDMIYWYRNRENPPVTVKASVKPESIPLNKLTWKAFDERKLTVTPGEDGTAVLTFLNGGNNSATVTAPDGTKGLVRIRTVTPVESIRMEKKGKAIPGKKVTYIVRFEPDKLIVKDVEWSIDVDEDIAVINEKGEIAIGPETKPGTVITVTCKALGAPEPLIVTDEMTVE